MERRDFIRVCAGSLGARTTLSPALAGPLQPRRYARARLIDAHGAQLRAASLAANRNYVFMYPYQSTPCFLLNLGKPIAPVMVRAAGGVEYQWPGGAGAARALVAYSAICSHQLAYPTRDISFISFRAGKTPVNKFADVIHCCSDHSQYDPAQGARVLSGPAPAPLAAILIEHDASADALYVTGTLGSDVFNAFFRKYEVKLSLDLGGRAKQAAGESCVVTELDNYCRQQVRC